MDRLPGTASPEPGGESFKTTHWSVVLSSGNASENVARQALEHLCRTYWPPLYAYVRRQGHSPEDAQDLTQGFFERFIERGYFALADPERGRFRTFLLTSLQRFMVEEWRKTSRQKRGGGQVLMTLPTTGAEEAYAAALHDDLSPDRLYDRRWAEVLLNRVMVCLAEDYASSGRAAMYKELQRSLWGGRAEVSYAELGAQLGMTEGAIKVAVHRLRHRFRDLLREEVADTVRTPEQVEEEMQHLLAAFTP